MNNFPFFSLLAFLISVPCCFISSSAVLPDISSLIFSIILALLLRVGDAADIEGFLGTVTFLKTSGWPLVLHLTVDLSPDSFILSFVSFVWYSSSALVSGVESFLGDRSCFVTAWKGEDAVSTRHLAGGGVCISTVTGRLLAGVLLSAALVDGTGEVCVSTDNGIFWGVDTACGRKLDISSSLLSQSLGVCWVLFFFLLVGRPPLHCWENFEHTLHCSDVSDESNSFHRNDAFSISDCAFWMVEDEGFSENFNFFKVA